MSNSKRNQQYAQLVVNHAIKRAKYSCIVDLVQSFVKLLIKQPFIDNLDQFVNYCFDFNLIVHITKNNKLIFTTLPHNNFEADQIYVNSDGTTNSKSFVDVQASSISRDLTIVSLKDAIYNNNVKFIK